MCLRASPDPLPPPPCPSSVLVTLYLPWVVFFLFFFSFLTSSLSQCSFLSKMQGFHQVTQTSVISRELILPTVLATRDIACYFGSHLSSLVPLCQLAES